MALYIDDAGRPAVEQALAAGLVSGVTTNPLVLARAGLGQGDVADVVAWTLAAGAERVYVQTRGLDADTIVAAGHELRSLDARVVVKVPATRAGLEACVRLHRDGVPLLATCVYTPAQVVAAASIGVEGVAPYVGRIDDLGRDGVEAVAQMVRIVAGTRTRVLAASIRDAETVGRLAAVGCHDQTLAPRVLDAVLDDPDALGAAEDFERAGP